MAGGHLQLVPSALSEAQARRPFLRAALLPHLLKPAVLEVPQTSHAACGSVNAVLPCCKEADPDNLDRWEENHVSFPHSYFSCNWVFFPAPYNSAKLFLSSGLCPVCLRCVEALCPELHRGLHPQLPPADGASRVLKEVLNSCTHRDVYLLCSSPVSLVCLATATPKSFLQCFFPSAPVLSIL